ncbi:outer membrane protein assembly factor BamD [Psychroserpens ponticola]|uniref:Outer membrane protein assembly factor BamD n=1 Tax=Psychroserpens ponticola TaxID=2932268 RepID=A0ABY7RUY0_9FLAO|nr:outer membrane protein assembly factor BamD [Psychroserpens ponticola]WCO00516.1 outer membrane protein assembly factor BamD [Psychroserpens ponticola]
MKKFVYILILAITLSSCSEYQKALKSEDVKVKLDMATKLFENGKYSKANKLFDQVVPKYRGKPQAERLMFMSAMCSYELKDYHISGYHFERFENSYPRSDKAQEASFLSAKSYYMLSPVYSKEQRETVEALEKLQLFINKYPDSDYLAEANVLIKELDFKLEKKAFEIAKQYNKIAYFESSDYEAAIKAFDNFLVDYPGTSFREEAMFFRLDSAYKLAINSVKSKKEERLEIAKGYYNTFHKYYPNSERTEEVEKMNEDLKTESQQFNTKS